MHFALEILVIIGRRKMSRLKLFYLLGSTLILLQTIGCGNCLEACGPIVFDPDRAICCDGVVHVLDYEMTCCCGTNIFDASVNICDNGTIVSRRADDEADCCQRKDARLDVAILADNSEGLSSSDLDSLKAFVKDLISSLNVTSGDVRVALVVFTHEVFIDFYLGNFTGQPDSITQMINVIDSAPTRSGGTETGKALNITRQKVFQEENGDRPEVPNVLLLTTDGKSNKPDETTALTDLLKDDGVFMIGIGVGDSILLEELQYVGSGEGNESVFFVENFNLLSSIEQQIREKFFSCKVFPTAPKCGSEEYDPATQLCCNDKVNDVSGSLSDYSCCGEDAFNFNTELCCNDVVKPVSGAVSDFRCCGLSNVYDITSELCCSGNPVAVAGNPANYVCCGDMAANNIFSELCCSDTVVPVPGPSQNYNCCGDALAYNLNTEICCLGNPVPVADGCCGDDEYFDPATQICCGGIVQPILGNDISLTECCNGTSYHIECSVCEDDQIVSIVNETTHICCQGNKYELIYDNNCCCGDQLFDSTLKVCCNDRIIDRPIWDKTACCECRGAKLDLAIVADNSESVEPFRDQLIEFLKSLILSASVNDGDDQIALIVYTHEVYTVFDLDDFGSVDDMLTAIDSWTWVSGGTNTAAALEELQNIFVSANGDRDDAANTVVLFSDGKADSFEATVAAADELKNAGVTIFAVGIEGETNFTELAAVASEPEEQYVYRETNFDALTDLRVPVKELAGDVCFDEPVHPPLPQCDGVSYWDEYYICCDGSIQPRVGGKRTACCGEISYDKKFHVCCDGNLAPAEAGKNTECCCRRSYNPDTHVCCGNRVRRKSAGEYTECCGDVQYDSRFEICCFNEVQESYGPGVTACCHTTSYNFKCYTCDENYDLIPMYDPSTEVCCDGNIQAISYGNQSCCCKDEQFDLKGKLCCEGKIRVVPDTSTCACCGDRLYDVVYQVCCDGKTRNILYGNMTVCCGGRVMNAENQLCCDGEIVNKSSSQDMDCCNGVPYDPNSQMCCNDRLNDLPVDADAKPMCCGRKLYDPMAQFCCGGRTYSLDSGTSCCGGRRYDPTLEICDKGNVVPVAPSTLSRCGRFSYCNAYQTCCEGTVQPMPSPGYTKCCYDTAYDVRNSTCCLGVLHESRPETRYQCCLKRAFLPRRRICCNGRLIRKILPSADQCCGRSGSYDPYRQICCNGRAQHLKSGVTTQCCGKKSFDPAWYICCSSNVLLPRKYGESTACCGSAVYNPMYHYCCEGEVIPKDGYPGLKAG